MRQLTGQSCIHCKSRIPSDLDGLFCRACGSPVHNQCLKPNDVRAACKSCGASATDCQAYRQGARADAREQQHSLPPGFEPLPADDWDTVRGFKYIAYGLLLLSVGFVWVLNDPQVGAQRMVLSVVIGGAIGVGLICLGVWFMIGGFGSK
ncbi:unnamed protein product [Gemmataceae bacterium]|nr:unnamed protein product [Gemmataceae bacterium]VTT97951.1 unnamed protein product [Gemmataceae bacterium]